MTLESNIACETDPEFILRFVCELNQIHITFRNTGNSSLNNFVINLQPPSSDSKMKLEIILCIIFLGAAFSAKVASTIKSFPNPDRVLSRDGFHVLNLFTDTAYTISNKGTGKLACFNSSLLSPDLLNLSHWWKIVPSRNFNKREPRYELVNFDGKGCDIGKTISFYSAPSSQNETDDTFLLSTEHCGKIKSCSGNGQIYNGLMYLDQGLSILYSVSIMLIN